MLGNRHIWVGVGAGILIGAMFQIVFLRAEEEKSVPLMPLVPLIASSETIIGERIVYPTAAPAKVTAVIVGLAPGQETGWHTHETPVFGYVLEGVLEVDYGSKGVRVYRTGDAVLEAIGDPHNGRNVGDGPMRILAVFMGAEGLKLSTPAARPAQ